jgi:hypothetical protein
MIEDGRSTRIRLGRWLVGIGAAIAGTTGDGLADDDRIVARSALTATTATAVKAAHGPCDDGPSTLSHAA